MRGTILPARSEKGSRGEAWRIAVELPAGDDGKRRRKWVVFDGSQRAAEKEWRRLQGLADANELPGPGRQTVGQYLEDWLKGYVKRRLTGQSPRIYGHAVKRLSAAIGHHRLDRLQPVHVQGAYDGFLAEGASPATVRLIHAVLHRALKQAIRLKLLTTNPTDGAEAPTQGQRREVTAISQEQALKLIGAAHADPQGLPIVLGLGLGIRLGEACALQWPDVDFRAGTVRIRRSLLPSGTYKAPKSGRGRAISLPEFVAIALRARQAEQKQYAAGVGDGWNPDNLVNPTSEGQPRYVHTTTLMRRLCEKAGIGAITFHALRHTCASLLLDAGENVKAVQERLGHSSATITLNVYGHLLPHSQERTAARLDSLLGAR